VKRQSSDRLTAWERSGYEKQALPAHRWTSYSRIQTLSLPVNSLDSEQNRSQFTSGSLWKPASPTTQFAQYLHRTGMVVRSKLEQARQQQAEAVAGAL